MVDMEKLVLIGYTNALQVMYGTKSEGGHGSFYADTEAESNIPVYIKQSELDKLDTNGWPEEAEAELMQQFKGKLPPTGKYDDLLAEQRPFPETKKLLEGHLPTVPLALQIGDTVRILEADNAYHEAGDELEIYNIKADGEVSLLDGSGGVVNYKPSQLERVIPEEKTS